MVRFDTSGAKYGKPVFTAPKLEPVSDQRCREVQELATELTCRQAPGVSTSHCNSPVINAQILEQKDSDACNWTERGFLHQQQVPEGSKAGSGNAKILFGPLATSLQVLPSPDHQVILKPPIISLATKHRRSLQTSKTAEPLPSPATKAFKSPESFPRKPQSTAHQNPAQRTHSPRIQPTPPEPEASTVIDIQDQIKQASKLSLRKIAGRQRGNDKHSTASLKDLDLARTPIDPTRPQSSERHWSYNPEIVVQDYVKRFDRTPENPFRTSEASHLSPQFENLSNQAVQDSTSKDEVAETRLTGQLLPVTSAVKTPATRKSELQKPKWALKQEMQPLGDPTKADSDTWALELASGAKKVCKGVDEPICGLLQHEKASEKSLTLADWQGKLIPPPPDWANRPKLDNKNPYFKEWLLRHPSARDEMALGETRFSNGVTYVVLPPTYLEDLDYQADGIGLVKKTFTINAANAQRYDYLNPYEVTKDIFPVGGDDFEDWGKLDLSVPLNKKFKDETTEDLVSNWLRHVENSRPYLKAYANLTVALPEEPLSPQRAQGTEAPRPPKLNIYLRPAIKADIPELTRIYNWHVETGPRTAEVYEVSEDDMRLRLSSSRGSKLPFIVAAKKCQRGSSSIDMDAEAEMFRNSGRHLSVQNIRRKHRTITRVEQLAGWVSAQDLTASDYVEHISAEVELYVDAECRSMGVGRCLMDKVLETCDRSYVPRGGYEFHCAQELQHLYNSGGGRDIHKLFILLRKWKSPISSVQASKGIKKKKASNLDDENAFEKWLSPWLESWRFKVEGTLVGVGAKHGRYIDTVYLGRESLWQADEGEVPDPFPGFNSNAIDGNADEENEN